MRFENKGVLITGATGGIGRETCFHFAQEGAAVAVTDLDLNLAERVAAEIREKGGKAHAYELDVTNQQQLILLSIDLPTTWGHSILFSVMQESAK